MERKPEPSQEQKPSDNDRDVDEALRQLKELESIVTKRAALVHIHLLKMALFRINKTLKDSKSDMETLFRSTGTRYGSTKTMVSITQWGSTTESVWGNFHSSFLHVYKRLVDFEILKELSLSNRVKTENGPSSKSVKQTLTFSSQTEKRKYDGSTESLLLTLVFTILRHAEEKESERGRP